MRKLHRLESRDGVFYDVSVKPEGNNTFVHVNVETGDSTSTLFLTPDEAVVLASRLLTYAEQARDQHEAYLNAP